MCCSCTVVSVVCSQFLNFLHLLAMDVGRSLFSILPCIATDRAVLLQHARCVV